MDKVSEYISKARSLGQTDDQIKQAFLDKGWPTSTTNSYFSATPLINNQKINSPNRFLSVLIIIIFCLAVIGTGVVIAIYYANGSKFKLNLAKNQITPTIGSEKSLEKTSDNKLLAFIQYNKDPIGGTNLETEVKFFDLSQKKMLPPDSLLSTEKNALPSFGNWSPDGKYLPILFVHASSEPTPFFFFDSLSKMSKKIYTFQVTKDSKYIGLSTGFWLNTRWLDDSRLVFYRDDLTKPSSQEFVITNDGTISEKDREKDYILQNSKMTVTEDVSTGSATIKSISIDNVKFPGVPKGQIVGLIKDDILSLESPAAPGIQDFAEGSELSKKMKSATSEAETAKIVAEAMKPKGNWIFHFYNINSGIETKSHEIKSEGRIVKNVQIRPQKNTIIIALQEKAIAPYSIRFVELEPSSMTYRTIGETSQMTAYPVLTLSNLDDYFNFSSDGEWLLTYDGQISDTNGGISAWNLSSGEKITICEKLCSNFRIFNPEALIQR